MSNSEILAFLFVIQIILDKQNKTKLDLKQA